MLVGYAHGVTKEVDIMRTVSTHSIQKSSDDVFARYLDHRQVSTEVGPCVAFGYLFVARDSSSNQHRQEDEQKLFKNAKFGQLLRLASLISEIDNDLQSYCKENLVGFSS